MFLYPKILTYALNAYTDANIAQELVHFITEGKFSTLQPVSVTSRASSLIKAAPDKKNTDYVIGLAYTQYCLNGLADILYADFLWNAVLDSRELRKKHFGRFVDSICKPLKPAYRFEAFLKKPGIHLWYWPVVINNPWRWTQEFAKITAVYTKQLDRNVLIKACIEVQKQNIENNRSLASVLRKGIKSADPKIRLMRQASLEYENSAAFLSTCAQTLEAAGKWDSRFLRILH